MLRISLLLFILTGLQACEPNDRKISTHLRFTYQIDPTYYPDVAIYLDFKSAPDSALVKHINSYKEEFKTKYVAYMDDLSPVDSATLYFLYCDFQATPYKQDMFDEFAQGLNAIEGIENLDTMKVE